MPLQIQAAREIESEREGEREREEELGAFYQKLRCISGTLAPYGRPELFDKWMTPELLFIVPGKLLEISRFAEISADGIAYSRSGSILTSLSGAIVPNFIRRNLHARVKRTCFKRKREFAARTRMLDPFLRIVSRTRLILNIYHRDILFGITNIWKNLSCEHIVIGELKNLFRGCQKEL